MTKTLYEQVASLVNTPVVKDWTYLSDWIADGDCDDMTPQEIADEWDALPEMESDY